MLKQLFTKNHDSVIIKNVPEENLREYFRAVYKEHKVPQDIRDVVHSLRIAYAGDLSKVNTVRFFGTNKRNGQYSNWWECSIPLDGHVFCNVEQYMMWRKAMLFNDTEIANQILKEKNPKTIKMLGRKVRGYNDKEWSKHRYDAVLKACTAKFSDANPELKEMMLAEEFPTFIECSPYDKIWGIGLDAQSIYVNTMSYWNGTNLLGRVLTEVWDNLQK